VLRGGRRSHPRRRRNHRRRGHGQRIRHHGESAPVIRESGGDRSAVTGGTTVLSDWIKIASPRPGLELSRSHDRARRGRAAPEDAQRDRLKHPAGGHDPHLLFERDDPELRQVCGGAISGVVLPFAVVTLIRPPSARCCRHRHRRHGPPRALFNVMAMSAAQVEAAGGRRHAAVDKTGTITLGNRQATEFIPLPGVSDRSWPTPPTGQPQRRYAGGPLRRRARQGEVRACAAAIWRRCMHVRPLHGRRPA